MAIAFSPDPELLLGSGEVYTPVNETINVSISDELSSETIQSVEIIGDPEDPEIILSTTNNSAHISGNHSLEIFNGSEIQYLPKGGTDKVDPVTVVSNPSNVPENKDIISVKSDPAQQKVVTYTVTATSSDGSVASAQYEFLVTQTYSAIRDWLNSYEL